MSPEFWEWMDTVAKISLGALIAAVSAFILAKLQHRQTVEQAAVRRRLELIEETTTGVSEFGNLIARYCLVSDNIVNAFYQPDGTIGEVPEAWIKERSSLGEQLKSGDALKEPEGLLYLIAGDNDGTLPIALSELQRLAEKVMQEAGCDIEDIQPINVDSALREFKKQAAALMVELGKVYRKPTF